MLETQTGERGWVWVLGFPLISGVVLAAAFPPLPLGFLAYLGLVPLILSAEKLEGRRAFGAGFFNGLVFHSLGLYWISWITPPGMVGTIFYLSLFRGLFVWALSLSARRLGTFGLWTAPFLWVAIEYFLSVGDMGFPWMGLAYTQSRYLPLIQYADITGPYGVSCWIVVVNLTLLSLWRMPSKRASILAADAILFAIPAAHGALVLSNAHVQPSVSVGLVQPNMSPIAKSNWGFDYNFGILKPLTQLASEGADLVIWPEASVPAYFGSSFHQGYRNRVQSLVDSIGIPLFTGANRLEAAPEEKQFNSSFLFRPGGTDLSHYDKIKLVPFGERAPFPELLPLLRKIQWSGGGYVSGNFDSGDTLTVFDGPGIRFSALICFDSVFPWLSRALVAEGAELLVVITNDGWFGRTPGPYQHAAMAVFRAIENRRDVVRCANTGISVFLDAYGRQSQATGIYHSEVLRGKVTPRSEITLYTRFGDVFSYACVALALMSLVVALIRIPGRIDSPADGVPSPGTSSAIEPMDDAEAELMRGHRPMPFLDHLEELRWHILKGLGAIVVGAIFCGIFSNEILKALIHPALAMAHPPALQTLKPMGMFIVKLEIALVGGGVLALPLLIYQLWQFVAPGLFSGERRFVTFVISSSTFCFVLGAVLAYGVVIPIAMTFFVGLTVDTGVQAQFDIGFYISFVLRLLVAFGLVFELPVITFFLAKIGLVTASRMKAGRRYAIVIGFLLAAILTPPDPISQMLMALPLVILYEISIWVARVVNPGEPG